MVAFKYLLVILGIGLFGSAGALVVYDVYVSSQLRRLLRRSREESAAGIGGIGLGAGETAGGSAGLAGYFSAGPLGPVRWQRALLLAGLAVVALLVTESVAVVPDGAAGVRVSQFWGVRPGTLYPGVHLVTPLVDSVALYDTREPIYLTSAGAVTGSFEIRTEESSCESASQKPCGWREVRNWKGGEMATKSFRAVTTDSVNRASTAALRRIGRIAITNQFSNYRAARLVKRAGN